MDKQTVKKIEVSVSLNSSLLKIIDECAEQLRYNREEFIEIACQQFIGQAELENIYYEQHTQQPEELQWACDLSGENFTCHAAHRSDLNPRCDSIPTDASGKLNR